MMTPAQQLSTFLLAILPLFSSKGHIYGRQHFGVRAKKACQTCSVSLYQGTGFGTLTCQAGDFGCYPDEDQMWIRPPCGGFFRCNTGRAAVQCGSRYFRPALGQDRLNCSCSSTHHRNVESAVDQGSRRACEGLREDFAFE